MSAADPSAYDFDSLVRRFAAKSGEAFRFLEEKGYRREYGALGYGSDPWRLEPGRQPAWPWFAVARYAKPPVTFEFRFGDREVNLEAEFLAGDGKERFALWELPSSLGGDPAVLAGAMWVIREPYLDGTLDRLSSALAEALPRFESAGEKELAAIRSDRERRRLLAQSEERQRDLERARIRSAEAFHAGRFQQAVDLLEPFGIDLDETDRKRLALAKKILAGQ